MELSTTNKTSNKAEKKTGGLYVLSVIARKISLPYQYIGSNLKEILQKKLSNELENKCSVEGFIRGNSVRIVSYSSGVLKSNNVVFDVVIECLICTPVEGMKIKIKVKNITKAGIRGDNGHSNSPIDVFIARDHHYSNKEFSNINVDDMITIRVVGQRYEINDEKISVIGELITARKRMLTVGKKPLVIMEEEEG